MSSTRIGPAFATPRISAIACAGIIISGAIARAKSSQIGFSAATVSSAGAIVPRRTVSVRPSTLCTIAGDPRNSIMVPRYAGDVLFRNTAESGVSWYASPVFERNPMTVR